MRQLHVDIMFLFIFFISLPGEIIYYLIGYIFWLVLFPSFSDSIPGIVGETSLL